MVSYLFDMARNNPDYAAAVLTGNAVIGFNILLHAVLVPQNYCFGPDGKSCLWARLSGCA